jgi:hypothetical protein
MDIQEYYTKAKDLSTDLSKAQLEEVEVLLKALNYNDGNEHPSDRVPQVQKALLAIYTQYPTLEQAKSLINLYDSGIVLEQGARQRIDLKLISLAFTIGLLIGWVLWA